MSLAIYTPTTFEDVDLNAIPDRFTYLRKYWFMNPFEKRVTWLLDQGRTDDAVVFFISETGWTSMYDLPFLPIAQVPGKIRVQNELIDRLESQGRIKQIHRTSAMFDLGLNSGIDRIVGDLTFFSEPSNPGYAFGNDESEPAYTFEGRA